MQSLRESAKRDAQIVNRFRIARFRDTIYLERELPQQLLGVLGGKLSGFGGRRHLRFVSFRFLFSHGDGLIAVDVSNVFGALRRGQSLSLGILSGVERAGGGTVCLFA